jgi:hypothetical protein
MRACVEGLLKANSRSARCRGAPPFSNDLMNEPVAESAAPPKPPAERHHAILTLAIIVVLVPVIIFSLWTWVSLGYTYSSGERAGYVQKLSKKGWLCKTWEGELAMANLPGTMPEIFRFSVRSDSIALLIDENIGKRVSLSYEQHRGVPTSCFGETEYFVTRVRAG